jgi:hypothetical protein
VATLQRLSKSSDRYREKQAKEVAYLKSFDIDIPNTAQVALSACSNGMLLSRDNLNTRWQLLCRVTSEQ